jgi:mRNA interferase ChpB
VHRTHAPVLSTSAFNALGTVLVAPIIQGGDFARQARRVETAPEFVIEDALARLRALTE